MSLENPQTLTAPPPPEDENIAAEAKKLAAEIAGATGVPNETKNAETEMVLKEMQAAEERKKIEAMMANGGGEGAKTVVLPAAEAAPETGKRESHEAIEVRLASARDAYARAAVEHEKISKQPINFEAGNAGNQEKGDAMRERQREYMAAVKEYRTLLREGGAAGKEVLLVTLAEEATKLYEAKTEAMLATREGGRWEGIKQRVEATVEGYRRLPLKQKLAVSAGLIGIGLAGVALGGLIGTAAVGGAALGRTALRTLGILTSFKGFSGIAERKLAARSEGKAREEIVKRANELLTLNEKGLEKELLNLSEQKREEAKKRLYASTAIGAAGAAATAALGSILGSKVAGMFGGGASETPPVSEGKTWTPRFDAGQFTAPEESRVNRIAEAALAASGEGNSPRLAETTDVAGGTYAVNAEAAPAEAIPEGDMLREPVGMTAAIENVSEKVTGPFETVVKEGDNLWNIIRDKAHEGGYLSKLTGAPEEVAAKRANIIANVLKQMEGKPKDFGVVSGDLDVIRPGEHVRLPDVLKDEAAMAKLVERANKLTPEQIQNILSGMKQAAKGQAVEALTQSHKPIRPLGAGMPYELWNQYLDEELTSEPVRPGGFSGWDNEPWMKELWGEGGTPSPEKVPDDMKWLTPKQIKEEALQRLRGYEVANRVALGFTGKIAVKDFWNVRSANVADFIHELSGKTEDIKAAFSSGQGIEVPGHKGVLSGPQLDRYLALRDLILQKMAEKPVAEDLLRKLNLGQFLGVIGPLAPKSPVL